MYIGGSDAVPGWASLFGAVGIIGGIQLLFLGVIGEYVSIIFDEVKRRPRYLVARRIGAGHTGSRTEQTYVDAVRASE
jgi:dolichol-phosphate mannosyltransferase